MKHAVLGIFLAAIMIGCDSGPDRGYVEGTITLDGEPLPKAQIEFTPTPARGRPSLGRTNDQGHYSLRYTRDLDGALLGEHTVRVITQDQFSEIPADRVEKVPPEYNMDSTLTATVERGNNTYDLDLVSPPGWKPGQNRTR